MNNTSLRAGIIFLTFVAVVGGALYFFMPNTTDKELEEFASEYRAWEFPHRQGNVDESINLLRELLAKAPREDWEARVKLKLAFSLFLRNRGEDQAEAVALYKDVAGGIRYSSLYQALALADMVQRIQMVDESLATKYVFNDPRYTPLLSQAGGNVGEALRLVYELSDSIFPNAFAKIQIAHGYSRQLNNPQASLSLPRKEVAERIQQYIRDAEPLLEAIPYEQSRLAQLYLFRAVALGVSDRELNNVGLVELEAAYRKAITAAESDDVYSQWVGSQARLFLATGIYSRVGVARESDLKVLLSTVAADATATTGTTAALWSAFLKGVAKRPDDEFFKKNVTALANISPEFKLVLQSNGWSF